MELTSLIIGAIVGLILGLTGAGGSIIAVPLLTLGLGLPLKEATGLALLAVLASSAFGVATRLRSQQILWLPGVVLAVTGAVTAPLGRVAAGWIPDVALATSFALLSIVISVRLWRQAAQTPEATRIVRASSDIAGDASGPLCRMNEWQPMQFRFRCMINMIGAGLGIGLLSGLFGVGGGFLIVPILMFLTGTSIRQAVGTSLLVISLVSLSGFVSHALMSDSASLTQAWPLAAGGVIGMLLGNRLGHRISGPNLQKLFAVTVIVITVIMLFRQFTN
ncbi:MAG: sulfite exporter TauE/SafE family protein [Gammaproteobacteria bacterium]|nr:MAG: sulfite exporter TauE/SafE family protein [Gammaproteobacteria bacterium]